MTRVLICLSPSSGLKVSASGSSCRLGGTCIMSQHRGGWAGGGARRHHLEPIGVFLESGGPTTGFLPGFCGSWNGSHLDPGPRTFHSPGRFASPALESSPGGPLWPASFFSWPLCKHIRNQVSGRRLSRRLLASPGFSLQV